MSDEQIAKALEMKSRGVAHREIGEALGFTQAQIRDQIKPTTIHRRTKQGRREWADQSVYRLFGVTTEQYEELLTRQGGGCAICRRADADITGSRLAIDHDHACCPGVKTCGNCIRGLLCRGCNLNLDRPWFRAKHGLIVDDYLEGRLISSWQPA
jgi:hypothetical protein